MRQTVDSSINDDADNLISRRLRFTWQGQGGTCPERQKLISTLCFIRTSHNFTNRRVATIKLSTERQ